MGGFWGENERRGILGGRGEEEYVLCLISTMDAVGAV